MVDAATIVILVGLATLVINELSKTVLRVRHSKCWGIDIEMEESPTAPTTPKRVSEVKPEEKQTGLTKHPPFDLS